MTSKPTPHVSPEELEHALGIARLATSEAVPPPYDPLDEEMCLSRALLALHAENARLREERDEAKESLAAEVGENLKLFDLLDLRTEADFGHDTSTQAIARKVSALSSREARLREALESAGALVQRIMLNEENGCGCDDHMSALCCARTGFDDCHLCLAVLALDGMRAALQEGREE